jgi:hypothetical protein
MRPSASDSANAAAMDGPPSATTRGITPSPLATRGVVDRAPHPLDQGGVELVGGAVEVHEGARGVGG